MHDGIIGVPLEWNLRKVRRQPSIKRIMQKQVGQQWTDHAPYTKGNFDLQSRLAVDCRLAEEPGAGLKCYGES